MRIWSITLHGPAGFISTVDTGESQFVVGTETASDVFKLEGEAVAPRHAWVWISEAGLQVEDLGGGTLVNGCQINERVQVEYPASFQVGEVTLVIEVKLVKPLGVSPNPSSMDITIPQRAVAKNKASLEVTIPQRTPIQGNVQNTASTRTPAAQAISSDKASTLCEYTLVREIARGGMGQIYFGEDPHLKRDVAVKVSSVSEAGEDPRFSKEAEVLAQLAHPNIVPIYNIGVDAQNRPFYSMKLIQGRTLQAVLNQIRDGDAAAIKDYPRATLLTIFRKVCDAMMFAHSKGILHRDLKPENIMVGEYGEVLVMDWGLAKTLGADSGGTSTLTSSNLGLEIGGSTAIGMTMEGEVMGTPQYMSPEQAEGMVAELDERSDIYSLGGVLYAILTLRPPVEGKTIQEVLGKVKRGQISSLITERGDGTKVEMRSAGPMECDVPEALSAVTLKAMSLDRAKRYGSVEEFASDLEAYQNGFATNAEQAGALRQLMLLVKRNKAVSGLVAVLLVAAISFVVRLEIEKEQARASEQRALASEQKALALSEISRRALADANMALAEIADLEFDSVALQRALDAVPDDMRTRDWHYFRDRIETATFTLKAPAEQSWVDLGDLPSKPDSMLALRSDGTLFSVNVKTGTLHALWKSPTQQRQLPGPIGVSASGRLIALLSTKVNASQVDVYSIETGERLGGFNVGRIPFTRALSVSEELCLFWGVSNVSTTLLEVWDWRSPRRLWFQFPKTPKFATMPLAELSQDQKSVLTFNQGVLERRAALSGEVIASGGYQDFSHDWYPWSTSCSADWTWFLSSMVGASGLRKINPWKGTLEFELPLKYGNFASAWIPPGDMFATVGKVSVATGILEVRSSSNGSVARSLPFLGKVRTSSDAPKICAKQNAVVVRLPSALKIWSMENLQPNLDLRRPSPQCVRLQNMQCLARVAPGQKESTIELTDFSQSDPKNSKLRQRSVPVGGLQHTAATPAGDRLLVGSVSKWGAYRVSDSGIEELWPVRDVAHAVNDGVALHSLDSRIWTGRQVLEFDSGRQLASVEDREGLNEANSAVWVGSNRVAEITYLNQQGSSVEEDSTEQVLLALWDAEAGRLLTKTHAPAAVWICASPDGLHLAEASSDKRVRIRNAQTLEVEQEFRCHESALTGVAWHPTLPLLVTGAKDGMIRVWNLARSKKVEEFMSGPHEMEKRHEDKHRLRIEITADGKELNVFRPGKVLVYRPQSFSGESGTNP